MSDSIRLSIVTICWNDLDNVKRTLNSLLSQSAGRGDWEHILIDGASTDGTLDWYTSLAPDFPGRAISGPDRGIFDAMNKAIEHARGEYIVYLNAGDVLHDADWLQRTLDRTSTGMVWGYGRAYVVDDEGRAVRPPVGMIPYSRRRHLLGRATICHQAVVMRHDLLASLGGFDLAMGTAADYHLLVRAAGTAEPESWDSIDIDYLAGGVSDVHVYRQLWRRHDARCNALDLNRVQRLLDGMWTCGQVVQIWLRKRIKPLLRRQR